MNLKRTALYEEHVKLGGRLIDFGGWELPVQYSGVMDEHLACRSAAGLFDVSHMGEVHVEGPDAEAYLQFLLSNDVSRIQIGQAQYSVMCNDHGGVVDDLITYRRAKDRFLVVINASNTDKDFAWMRSVLSRKPWDVRVENQSQDWSQIALQGRISQNLLQPLTDVSVASLKNYWFSEGQILGEIPAIIARTGYTGEDGFEIYVPWAAAPRVWSELLSRGAPLGLKPCGLGARDTLRLEVKYPLYGHEMDESTNPFETGLGWVIRMEKDFVGRNALAEKQSKGLPRKLVGVELRAPGIPRQGYRVFDASGQAELGVVTSGTQSPSLKKAIALAYLPLSSGSTGTPVTIEIRGQKIPAEVVPTPFYKRNY